MSWPKGRDSREISRRKRKRKRKEPIPRFHRETRNGMKARLSLREICFWVTVVTVGFPLPRKSMQQDAASLEPIPGASRQGSECRLVPTN